MKSEIVLQQTNNRDRCLEETVKYRRKVEGFRELERRLHLYLGPQSSCQPNKTSLKLGLPRNPGKVKFKVKIKTSRFNKLRGIKLK